MAVDVLIALNNRDDAAARTALRDAGAYDDPELAAGLITAIGGLHLELLAYSLDDDRHQVHRYLENMRLGMPWVGSLLDSDPPDKG